MLRIGPAAGDYGQLSGSSVIKGGVVRRLSRRPLRHPETLSQGGGSVDPLPQDVGVAGVPSGLLDHVHEDDP